ncbi:hypothetical protein RAS12_08470 [Achromobacter seleniivolatilans]|uniref:Transglutaminase-like domain-containing protein n=1 Tax=Achromobacter seleniivolatilans TaxID=3047478 RepID=A0ABY9M711_9BURK|nr:hypothetical protein [Achromobacter sp. R39]WMD22398.1 hypothetical protein RAS12_08470 [Achromobacter sp. R39]
MPYRQHYPNHAGLGGIRIKPPESRQAAYALQGLERFLSGLALRNAVSCSGLAGVSPGAHAWLKAAFAGAALPGHDTTGVARVLQLHTYTSDADLDREIVLAMLASPVAFTFPNIPELESAVRIRRYIVQAARKTALAFDTIHAERPEDYWTYDETRGFTVLPGRSLIDGLRKATQPEASGQLYAFSCYRATEYVTVLGIAQELQHANPELAGRLQRQWETRAVMSGRFHDAFLHEYGSMAEPLPQRFYVPGDRLWFRNPDSASSDVEGYEGSWVFYLGNGQFNNFWERGSPYTLTSKCVEIFHWRHGLCTDAAGNAYIDEQIVKEHVRRTLADPEATAAVLDRMMRIRDPQGVYEEGGCIDATRERVRWVQAEHSDIVLPEYPQPAAMWSIAA